jgi:hypothetical protein
MADLDLQAQRARTMTEIEEDMGRFVGLEGELEKADVLANYSARTVINVEVYFCLVTCKLITYHYIEYASSVITIG